MIAEYAQMYIDMGFGVGGPASFFALLFLFFGRILPIILQAPFLGARILPHPVKVAFAILLFMVFLPQLMATTNRPLTFNPLLVLYFAKELVVGTLLGFFVSIPFMVAQSAGIYIDHQRGGASLMINDPAIQNQSSPLGTLFNLILIYLFYLVDAPFLFFDALSRSYQVLPPDQFLSPTFFLEDTPFYILITESVGELVRIAAQLAAPGLIAILMTDVFLGIANRLAPQVQITFLGLPLKSLLALLAVCFGWQLLVGQMVKETFIWIHKIYDTVNYLSIK